MPHQVTDEQLQALRDAAEWLDTYAGDEHLAARADDAGDNTPPSWAVTARAAADRAADVLAALGVPLHRADYGDDDADDEGYAEDGPDDAPGT